MNDWGGSWTNTNPVFYATTSGTTSLTSGTYVLQPAQPVVPPKPAPEDEMAWLRRRVSEITELIAA